MDMAVEWRGLTKMAQNLYGVPRFMDKTISDWYTRPMMMRVWDRYVANLQGPRRPRNFRGPVPATLPVGIRSGELLAGANKVQLNALASRVFNAVPHASYIEFGTEHMAPRRPLGTAVDVESQAVPGQMGEVMDRLRQYAEN
ncbi:MAG: hypothetical protein JW940_27320 [Polyangiaceae bacterium]|nr:hypothetical protein [Polyangiaceae bacterium]